MGLTSSGGVAVNWKLPARRDPAHFFSHRVITDSVGPLRLVLRRRCWCWEELSARNRGESTALWDALMPTPNSAAE